MRALALAWALALAGAAWADEAALLDALKLRSPKLFAVVRLPPEDPKAPIIGIFGDLADKHPKNRYQAINAWVKTYGALSGFPAGELGDRLSKLKDIPHGKGVTMVYVHVDAGDPTVFWVGGAMGFHFNQDDHLVGVTGRYRDLAAIGSGAVDHPKAIQTALEAIRLKFPGAHLSGNGELIVALMATPEDQLVRTYWINVIVGREKRARQVIVADDGTIINDGEGAQTFDAKGTVFDGYPAQYVTPGALLPRLLDANRSRRHYRLIGEKFVSDSKAINKAVSTKGVFDFPKDYVRVLKDGTPKRITHPRFLETHVWHHIHRAYEKGIALGAAELEEHRYTYNVWQRPEKDRPATVNNAFYQSADDTFVFAMNNPGYDYRHPAADASVVYHEFGHAVLHAISPYHEWYDDKRELGEGGAIYEGFADFFASQVSGNSVVAEIYLGAEKRSPDIDTPYAKRMPMWDIAQEQKHWLPATRDPAKEIHPAGQLFSGIAAAMTSNRDDPDAALRIVRAVRISHPMTFRSFGLSLLAVHAIENDEKTFPFALERLFHAGVFADVKVD